MKNQRFLLSVFIIILVAIACLTGCAVSDGNETAQPNEPAVAEDLTRTDADTFASTEIQIRIKQDSPICVWNETTTWSEVIPLYDCYDICNGYVYILQTNGQRTGYIQVNQYDGQLIASSLSYEGIPAYEGLATDRQKLTSDDKLYYFGSMNYYLKLDENTFQRIGSANTVSMADAETQYNDFLERFAESMAEIAAETEGDHSSGQ